MQLCASIWKVLQAAKGGGKRSGRGRSATLETQHTFLTIDSRSTMLHEMMAFRRYFSRTSAYSSFDKNRLWPLNLFSLVGTSITISEQYFRSNANCEEIFLFPERQKKVVAFGHSRSLKKQFNQKKISVVFGKNSSKQT